MGTAAGAVVRATMSTMTKTTTMITMTTTTTETTAFYSQLEKMFGLIVVSRDFCHAYDVVVDGNTLSKT